jgi:hypothetical protein
VITIDNSRCQEAASNAIGLISFERNVREERPIPCLLTKIKKDPPRKAAKDLYYPGNHQQRPNRSTVCFAAFINHITVGFFGDFLGARSFKIKATFH